MNLKIDYYGLPLEVNCKITGEDVYLGLHHPDNEESELEITSITLEGHDVKPLINANNDWLYIGELIYEEADKQYGY